MIKGNWQTKEVTIFDRVLNLDRSLQLVNHSPSGFNWGYGGSGPAQLALALLIEFMPNKETLAIRLHQQFKVDVIADLPQEDFSLKEDIVLDWVSENVKEE